jgi:DNA repair protein RadD
VRELRPYQREAVEAVLAYWRDRGADALVEMATGTGKSLIAAEVCRRLLAADPSHRIGVIAHVHELIAQNFSQTIQHWPQCPAGIYSAGLGRKDARARVLFGGIQSLHDKTHLGRFDTLIIDEAHLISPKSNTMYQRFIGRCRELNPGLKTLKMTATPYRLDSGALEGTAVYSYGIAKGIRDGWLSPLLSKSMLHEINVDEAGIQGGDFIQSDLEAAAIIPGAVRSAVNEMIAYGRERKSWIIFCTGIEHAHQVRMALIGRNIDAETLTSKTPRDERRRLVRDFKAGHIRALISVGILTTGFDAPNVDLLALMRPTLSTGLYVQMAGRGTRLAEGKRNCLVLDFAGVVRRHGPVDMVSVAARDGEPAIKVKRDDVRARVCPECQALLVLTAKVCDQCGREVARSVRKINEAAADGENAILSGQDRPRWVKVQDWSAREHSKDGVKSLCVEYWCGFSSYREWVCLEHTGFSRQKAEEWWKKHKGTGAPCVTEALKQFNQLRRPDEIAVRQEGKYFRILARRFGAGNPAALEGAERSSSAGTHRWKQLDLPG